MRSFAALTEVAGGRPAGSEFATAARYFQPYRLWQKGGLQATRMASSAPLTGMEVKDDVPVKDNRERNEGPVSEA